MNKNYYEILEISTDAQEAEIKSAYRRLVRKYHPDVAPNREDFVAHFKKIAAAYEVLSDKSKKKSYDLLNGFNQPKDFSNTTRSQAKKAYENQNKPQNKPTAHDKSQNLKFASKNSYMTQKDKNSFQDVFTNILDGIFSESKNTAQKNNSKREMSKDGSDIHSTISISQKEALEGTRRVVNILHTEPCPKCEGRKFINGTKCSLCNGSGETSVQKKISVKIPPYIKANSEIRIANEGNKGINGGHDGDLYLVVLIEKASFFKLENNTTVCEIPLTAFEAALGCTIKVPTPNGDISMKFPACTSSGQKFRLVEQGLKDLKTSKHTDLIVCVKIEMPYSLTNEEILLYEKLKKISKHKIRENLQYV